MNRMKTALKISIKNNISSKFAIAILLGMKLLFIGIPLIISVKLLLIPLITKNDMESVRLYFSLLLFGTCLISTGLGADVFGGGFLMKEKPSRIYESLLATPLTARELWITKVISVFIPSFVIAEFITAASYVFIQYLYVNPVLGHVLSTVDFFSIFLTIPFIYFFTLSTGFLVGLHTSHLTGNIIIQMFLPVYIQISINIAARAMHLTPVNFLLFNLGIAVISILPVLILLPKLTKENIVLSTRK